MALGKNVEKRRNQLGLTQSQLADMVGVSQTAITLLETRDSKSSRNMAQLVDALRTTHEQLLSGNFEEPKERTLNEREKEFLSDAFALSEESFESLFSIVSALKIADQQKLK